jgi:hypothetical protein
MHKRELFVNWLTTFKTMNKIASDDDPILPNLSLYQEGGYNPPQ